MIRIDRRFIQGVKAAVSADELAFYLQNAIELEHSTIPPYLTALFSLKPGTNDAIASRIRGIVIEEMLHMCIASNILVAIGGAPAINAARFVPAYPGPLPMSIGGKDFVVGIEPFSIDLVRNTFMVIEEPEHPIPIKVAAQQAQPEFGTIGEFYAAVQAKIAELGDGIFRVGPERQVLTWFDRSRLFPIVDVRTANAAIEVIVTEGEGTSTSPYQSPGSPAHYYTFGEIAAGRALVQTANGYAYGGAPIPFDASGVYPMKANPKLADAPAGSQAWMRMQAYNQSYCSLLNALHVSFNGTPTTIDTAIGLMYDLKVLAVALMQTPLGDGSDLNAGPSYEFPAP